MTKCGKCGANNWNGGSVCPACRQGVKRTDPMEEIGHAEMAIRKLEAAGDFRGRDDMIKSLRGRIETIRRERGHETGEPV